MMGWTAHSEEVAVDFDFTEEQLMIQDVARRLAQEKIAPSAEHHDRTGEFPLENIRILGENGLMGIEVPTVRHVHALAQARARALGID